MTEKVSVLVPIYNSEPYLRQCLDSIINQSYQNLEIILLNDGSSDGSAMICEEFVSRDARVRAIHNPLGGSGVGPARNQVLQYVTGDYILFVDNDDWLELDHIEKLHKHLKESGADIAIGNFTQFDNATSTFKFHLKSEDFYQAVYRPQEWFAFQYEGRHCLSQCFTVPWAKLYKAELYKHIRYPEDKKIEDDFTTWKVYLLADKIAFSNESIYYHRKLSTSVSKTVDLKDVFPLKSVEERITVLSMLGYDISGELQAYRYRMRLHRESLEQQPGTKDYQDLLWQEQVLGKGSK